MIATTNTVLAFVGKDIQFLKGIEQFDGYAEAGMRATVTAVRDDEDQHDPCYRISVSFAKFEDHNKAFEQSNYFDNDSNPTLNAREANMYSVDDFFYAGNDWGDCFKLVDDGTQKLLDLFAVDQQAQPNLTYTDWLEALVLAAMPHLKGAAND